MVRGLGLVEGGGESAVNGSVNFESPGLDRGEPAVAFERLDAARLGKSSAERDGLRHPREVISLAECVTPQRCRFDAADQLRVGQGTGLSALGLGRLHQGLGLGDIGMHPFGDGDGMVEGEMLDQLGDSLNGRHDDDHGDQAQKPKCLDEIWSWVSGPGG
jgi:hypothetical protein